jgi:hypothetical protein
MNAEWIKDNKNMTTQESIDLAVLKQRVDTHELLLKDMSEIKTNVALLVDKLKDFSPANCPVHLIKVNNLEDRMTKAEDKLDGVYKRVIYWSGGLAVITFLITYLILPIFTNNNHIDKKTSSVNAPIVSISK